MGSFVGTIIKFQDIFERLKVNGSSAVYFKDIKEYLSKTIKNNKIKFQFNLKIILFKDLNTVKLAVLFYLNSNEKAIRERFQIYLHDEFLGGFDNDLCRNHSLLWFNDVVNMQMWALQSKQLFHFELYLD